MEVFPVISRANPAEKFSSEAQGAVFTASVG